ncbi:hypothetical protein JCM10212_005984 [Sporobolomyces blumeae]
MLASRAYDSIARSALVDGSGEAPYLTDPSFLLFAIFHLLLGLFLVTYGNRGWRVSTGVGTGLLVEFLVWVALVNTVPSTGFSRSTFEDTGLIVWGIVTVCGIVSSVIGATFWRVGVFASGASAGLSFGISIALMGDEALGSLARRVRVFHVHPT